MLPFLLTDFLGLRFFGDIFLRGVVCRSFNRSLAACMEFLPTAALLVSVSLVLLAVLRAVATGLRGGTFKDRADCAWRFPLRKLRAEELLLAPTAGRDGVGMRGTEGRPLALVLVSLLVLALALALVLEPVPVPVPTPGSDKLPMLGRLAACDEPLPVTSSLLPLLAAR